MRTFMTYLVTVFLMLTIVQPTLAQTGPSSPEAVEMQSQAPPVLPVPRTPTPGAAISIYASSSPVAQGTVVQYLMNPHGEVDGLLLSDDIQVHFPPPHGG